MAAKTRTIVRYAKRKAHRRSSKFTLAVAPLAGLAVGMVPVIQKALQNPEEGANQFVFRYTGYNPWEKRWQPKAALNFGLGPLILGAGIHMIASKIGLNRALAGAGVPIFRV